MEYKGVIHGWFETGLEGVVWAFQDESGILPDGRWSYDGLIPLERGDRLTILDDEGKVLWEGKVKPSKGTVAGPYRTHWVQDGVDPKVWASWFCREQNLKAVLKPRILPRSMAKQLYENKWVSLFQVGNYVYSHETRCKGATVSVLVFDSTKPGQIYGRIENCPAHFEGMQLHSVTGGVENNDPMTTALHEIYEEAGYTAKREELIPLGTIRPSKSADTVTYLFAWDANGQTPVEPKGDGSAEEEDCYCEWWDEKEAILRTRDPLLIASLSRKKVYDELDASKSK
jgi:8-oxo-dGTP pyrophosphatase MutT (NUDIX family)